VNVYYRSDFAEILAWSIFPLLILAALRVGRSGWREVPFLGVCLAAIWLSNAPAGVIATYSLGLVLATDYIRSRRTASFLWGIAATALGFGLAAFYIFPAAWEQRWVQIAQSVAENLHPHENFLFTHANDPEFVFFNWKVSTVAMVMMLVAGIAAVFAARRRRQNPALWWILAVLGAASILLMFPITDPVWNLVPKLRFIQFPWRWLGPLGLVFAIFTAASAPGATWAHARRMQSAWWACVMLLICATGAAIIYDAWWDSEDIPFLSASVKSGLGYEGTDEYLPVQANRYDLPSQSPSPIVGLLDRRTGSIKALEDAQIQTKKWTSEDRSFQETSHEPKNLSVRILDYPAWQLWVDGAIANKKDALDTGQILLPIAAGNHRVEIRFAETWDRITGAGISAFSAVVAIFLVGLKLRESQPL
jgi:hypothetical protein